MKKKALVLITTFSLSTALLSVFLVSVDSKTTIDAKAGTCLNHNGYHYYYLAPDVGVAGHEEFWTCCVCHQQFLEEPYGTFYDQFDYDMTGGIDENHIAYIAPLEGGVFGDPNMKQTDFPIIDFEW